MKAINAVASVLLLVSCATTGLRTGVWTLRTPDGSTSKVEISELRQHEYYLRAPDRTFSGAYYLDGGELHMSKPDNPRMAGYVWNLGADGVLVLVEEPAVPVSGVRLLSATMSKAASE